MGQVWTGTKNGWWFEKGKVWWLDVCVSDDMVWCRGKVELSSSAGAVLGNGDGATLNVC